MGDTKEKGLSGRECTTELHNPSNVESEKSGQNEEYSY